MLGSVRTLYLPIVYRSIAHNAIRSVAPARLFAIIKTYEPVVYHRNCTKLQVELGECESPVFPERRLRPAMDCLRPTRLRLIRSAEEDKVELRPSCKFTGHFAPSRDLQVQYAGQMKTLHDCMEMIERHETRTGERFAAVLKLRPDIIFFQPMQPTRELLRIADGGMLWSGEPGRHMTDWVMFTARRHLQVFKGWWRRYMRCNTTWQWGENPEQALWMLGERLGARPQAELRWPVIIRRAKVQESGHTRSCARIASVVGNLTECLAAAAADVPAGCGPVRLVPPQRRK